MSAKKAKEQAQPKQKELEKDVQPDTNQEAAEKPEVKQEAGEVDSLKAQTAELNERLLRTLAEYDNYRKRSQRERQELYPEAVAATISKFLPALDNFDRALESECTDAEFKKGVEMIYNAMWETLKGMGVEEIEAAGLPFDPNLHNAVMHIEDDSFGENAVAQVLQKGYRIGERVLRHAMVQVAN